jgi:hypothetical protein
LLAATPKRDSKDKQITQLLQVPAVIEEETTPACVRFALGPTPQKDGEVLGIFDTLPAGTPSKDSVLPHAETEFTVSATPSKNVRSSSDTKLSRTPQSSGKRFYLGAFVGTPLKRKREDEDCTPSTAKRLFATPSFLRRNVPLARIDEDANEGASTAPPFKKRGLVRSLSSIIQGLRKQEEERMDDEWEILREIEEDESGDADKSSPPKVLVEDSQAAEMPLGPDQVPDLSEDDAKDLDPGSLDANGNPRKVWKKKGQKRQTKRVKMRPVQHKAKKAAAAEPAEEERNENEAVEETQDLLEKGPAFEEESYDQKSEDANDNDNESDFGRETAKPKGAQKSKKPAKRKGAGSKIDEGNDDKKDRKSKKAAPGAHANFRKLKIKNKNSKANGRGRKFGRR